MSKIIIIFWTFVNYFRQFIGFAFNINAFHGAKKFQKTIDKSIINHYIIYNDKKMTKQTSKYKRIYGLTLQQISEKLELSMPTVQALVNGKRKNYHPLTLRRFHEFLREHTGANPE
jgi:hypothetical protein